MKLVIAVILMFVIADLILVAYVFYRRYRKKISQHLIDEVRAQWKEIISQSDYRHAIMDADKLLDYTLSQMGMKGSLGAKLKKSPRLFSDLNGVWSAHKIRNNIAHQMNFSVDEKMYKKTMLQFKQAFKDLKIF